MNVTNNEEILVVTLSTVLVLEDITCNWSILRSSTRGVSVSNTIFRRNERFIRRFQNVLQGSDMNLPHRQWSSKLDYFRFLTSCQKLLWRGINNYFWER